MCPQISPVDLGPGATATATGTWLKYEDVAASGRSPQWRQAPPGSYRLTVAPEGLGPRERAGLSASVSIAPPPARTVPGPTPTIPVPG